MVVTTHHNIPTDFSSSGAEGEAQYSTLTNALSFCYKEDTGIDCSKQKVENSS
jgi:hypothetical protein